MAETEQRPAQDVGQDEAHAANILNTYGDTRNLITNALKQAQQELAEINSITIQALQNAVENANKENDMNGATFSISGYTCLYCGEVFHDMEKPKEISEKELLEHDKICSKNPLVIENKKLQTENERLKKEFNATQSRFETMAELANKRGIAIQEAIEIMDEEPAKKILEQALEGK